MEELDEELIAEKLNNDFDFFVNFTHKKLFKADFIWSYYNQKIVKELLKAFRLEYLFLIINIPPRLGKTILIIYFMAWTIYKNPKTYHNYFSYSNRLIDSCYEMIEKIFKIDEIANSVEFAYKRKNGKEYTDFSNEFQGGMYASTILGQVTGVGAGKKEDMDEFSGAIFIDDPHKVQDSIVKIVSANKAVKNACLNRKNNSRVPVIMIMQRVHKDDATAKILEVYEELFKEGRAYHLVMPVEKDGKTISKREYPLDLIAIEKEKDPYYYWTQLMQDPRSVDGKYFQDKIFAGYDDQKTNKTHVTFSFNPTNPNEPIVLLAFAKDSKKNAVSLDYKEDSFEAGSFFNDLKEFTKKVNAKTIHIPKTLMSETIKQELKPIKIVELEEEPNFELETFYSVELLKGSKILLPKTDHFEGLKEELKLFPNSKREYSAKAVVNALKILYLKDGNRVSNSL